VRIASAAIDSGGPRIIVRWASFRTATKSSAPAGPPLDVQRLAFVLINAGRGEALQLQRAGSGSGMVAMATFGSGASINEVELVWSIDEEERGMAEVDDRWLRDARLRILEWGPAQRYRVTVPVIVSDSSRMP
jgi:hypothetical protein